MTGGEMRRIRKGLGLTQKQLAEKVGISWNSIARQERNKMGISEPVARLVRILAGQKAKKGGRGKRR